MPDIVLSHTLTAGTPEDINDVQDNFEALRDGVNGTLDADNLADATTEKLGLSQTGTVRRGKSIITTEETTTSTSYTDLTTPDRVASLVLPTDGLIFVLFQAEWKCSVAANGRAAIFLGAEQLKVSPGGSGAVPVVTEAVSNDTDYQSLATVDGVLRGSVTGTAYTGDVTTGQAITTNENAGSLVPIFAAAGTYDIGIRFKVSAAATLSARNRKLWVWSQAF